ncbi:DUF6588 family protein [uncultured Polaribacter sp.]|uniref:DUF6588 family protein n=1 Tax=uncultured Polaribacter sp. TaxID=174711 RepID=UPI00263011C5|nr:DUF6588 family protein [uncultured Polaribacter sp.]
MKKSISIIFFTFCSFLSFSQIDLESVLEGGTEDAQLLMKGYLKPFAAGFGNGINGGWYTTAKAHKLLGIDVAVIANAAFVPKTDETFTFTNSDYANIKLDANPNDPTASAQLPSLFGSQSLDDRPLLEFSSTDGKISTSALPGSGLKEAIGYNVVPSAMVQLGVGLFKNTDVKVRFVPQQSEPEFEFSTFGIGVMHDLKQWVPFINKLPFDVSAFAGWNNIKSKAFLDANNNPTQAVEFNTKTTMFQILASKKLAIFTLFGGVGTTSYETDVNMLGNYETDSQTFTDPVSLNYSGSSVRANLGLSIKLLFLNISADYAIQEYNTLSVRAGFTIR